MENHTSTLYTHLDKLKQVNLSIYAQLKVPHTFEFKCSKNEETFRMKPPIISLFLNNKNWAKQEMNDERNKLLTFIAVEWTENQRVFTNHGRNGQELPPPEPRTARTLSWMARAGEEERGYRPGLFYPSWSYQPGPNPLHLSRLNGQMEGIWSRLVAPTGTKDPGLYPLSSSPVRAIQLSVLAVLGSGGGSFCPFHPRFVKTLWFPVHSTAIKFRSLFLS